MRHTCRARLGVLLGHSLESDLGREGLEEFRAADFPVGSGHCDEECESSLENKAYPKELGQIMIGKGTTMC